jgi:hypothetical protein
VRNLVNISLLCLVVAGCVWAAGQQAADSTAAAGTDAVADSARETPFSSSALDKALGTTGAEPLDDISLYSSGRVLHCELGLVIRNAEGDHVSLTIHDAKGRSVLSDQYDAGSRVINVQTDAFPTGIYVYTVRMADSVYTRPFIVTPR